MPDKIRRATTELQQSSQRKSKESSVNKGQSKDREERIQKASGRIYLILGPQSERKKGRKIKGLPYVLHANHLCLS